MKGHLDMSMDKLRERRERQEFLDRAFLAALPLVIDRNQNWVRNKQPATLLEDRIEVAWDIAVVALERRRITT